MKQRSIAAFVDRDGTVIHDRGYLEDPNGVELMPGAGDALAALSRAGLKLVLVTNQSGVGRGYFSVDAVHRQHDRLTELLKPFGIAFDAIEICPHAPRDQCQCRKPAPGMLLRAARRLGVDLARSFMIGDKTSDMEVARRAGCRAAVGLGQARNADYRAVDMMDAANYILARLKQG